MNIIITGATSFLGAAMVKWLLELNHQIFAVIRPDSNNRRALETVEQEPKLHILELELEKLHQIASFIQEPCDIFLHFGWDGSGSQNRMKRDVQQKNVSDSMKALEGARKLGCKRFIFSGSQAEYGICQTAMNEETPCHPVSEYGKAKVEFYHQARNQCDVWKKQGLAEMEYIHARIFSVYGKGDHPWSLVNTCLKTFREGGHMELGECTQQWNFLYIDDFTEAMCFLMFAETLDLEHNIYNIAGDTWATMPLRQYVEVMKKACHDQGTLTYGTRAPGAEGPANLIPDIKKLVTATGWQPKITFEEGIRRMLEIESSKCLLCGHVLPETPLMVLDDMPSSAQDIPDEYLVTQDTGIELQLYQCQHCGLVQFDCEPVWYYRDVIRSGGFSTTMAELRTSQYQHLIGTYHLQGKKFIEVGCGRGEFLSVLTRFPVEAYGIEHKEELVHIAREQGLNVCHGFTEDEDTILGTEGPYDVFLSFNFLEHQANPGKMLDCIYGNLSEDGMGLITVPSLEYILQYDGYYELIRDHIAYYSFDTLTFLLELHGFEVLEKEMVNRDTCSVIVRKKTVEKQAEGNCQKPSFTPVDLSGLLSGRIIITQELEQLMERLNAEHKTLAIWGASHQGFTLAATTCLGECAKYIIDSAPFKQGRFAPASHLPIVEPDYVKKQPVDVILIVAPGYTKEISESIRSRFGSDIKIMTLRSDHLEELEEYA